MKSRLAGGYAIGYRFDAMSPSKAGMIVQSTLALTAIKNKIAEIPQSDRAL